MINPNLYHRAQSALNELKTCVFELLSTAGDHGLSNAEIGRSLGIYMGEIDKEKPTHEGHVSRVLLGIMVVEGTVKQDRSSKRWFLRTS